MEPLSHLPQTQSSFQPPLQQTGSCRSCGKPNLDIHTLSSHLAIRHGKVDLSTAEICSYFEGEGLDEQDAMDSQDSQEVDEARQQDQGYSLGCARDSWVKLNITEEASQRRESFLPCSQLPKTNKTQAPSPHKRNPLSALSPYRQPHETASAGSFKKPFPPVTTSSKWNDEDALESYLAQIAEEQAAQEGPVTEGPTLGPAGKSKASGGVVEQRLGVGR